MTQNIPSIKDECNYYLQQRDSLTLILTSLKQFTYDIVDDDTDFKYFFLKDFSSGCFLLAYECAIYALDKMWNILDRKYRNALNSYQIAIKTGDVREN